MLSRESQSPEGAQEVNLETELSPEIIEAAMAKVIDINRRGTAVHTIEGDKADWPPRQHGSPQESIDYYSKLLASNINIGILPVRGRETSSDDEKVEKRKEQIKEARLKKEPKGYFHPLGQTWINIVGFAHKASSRWIEGKRFGPHKISKVSDFGYMHLQPASITLVLDTEKLLKQREVIEEPASHPNGTFHDYEYDNDARKEGSNSSGGYVPVKQPIPTPRIESLEFLEEQFREKVVPSETHGFRVKGRIPPRTIRGVVVGIKKENMDNGVKRAAEMDGVNYFDNDPTVVKPAVDRAAQAMLDGAKGRPDRIVPIYDPEGNLLWPKKMSLQEIREMEDEKPKE
ncbi:hypothetical protein KKG41_06875 [Patescibacteria group bacterium]|nr:hypothetical protein [Patescibacteria group bacterium]MBU1890997.1 hypothetical protein [Patescibacteria group bacterium]